MLQFRVKTIIFAVFFILGCSSPNSRERIEQARASAHHSYAADGMDSFWLDYRSPPDKEVRNWEFYYKHCSVRDNKPYYDPADYMCTEPY